MGLFDLIRGKGINEYIEEYKNDENGFLLDVRESYEFSGGRIPGAKNLPGARITEIDKLVKDKNKNIYVYCLSGGRSSMATAQLKRLGYENAINIGGISSYKGDIER